MIVGAPFLPLRARPLRAGDALCVGDDGRFFSASRDFLTRLIRDDLSSEELDFLKKEGHLVETEDRLQLSAYAYTLTERLTAAGPLDYLILVPTLRCNLSCSYCQVSRAGINQPGFDWDEATFAAVLEAIDRLTTRSIKIEFQGGEPTLRPDLIRKVVTRCDRFDTRQFVVCTNLQYIDSESLAIFDNPDVYISTSLDGGEATHGRNRTRNDDATRKFFENLQAIVERYGPHKVSALPTIDPYEPPDIDELIDSYVRFGLTSVFLRPINFQGFARKRHKSSRTLAPQWTSYYEKFVRRLIQRNWLDKTRVLEETYLSICLRRIFQPGADRHVDLRNPNPMGVDYIVIDYDGTVYPTDEARMLSRSGVIDLSIGDVFSGWATETRDVLNRNATNQFDPACQRCAFQPFCGRDLVDDLARYGRIDVPRTETEFCRRHLSVFDFAFELIYDPDPAVRYSLSRWLRLPGTPDDFGARLP